MPARLEPADLLVLRDLVLQRGGAHADFVAAVEAVSLKGQQKRRLLRLLRAYVVAAYRLSLRDDGATVLLPIEAQSLMDRAVGEIRDWVAPTWSESREIARLCAAGHTYACASHSLWIGECSCAAGTEAVAPLPRSATLARFGSLAGRVVPRLSEEPPPLGRIDEGGPPGE